MSRRYSAIRLWVILLAVAIAAAVLAPTIAFAQGTASAGDAAAAPVKDPLKPFIMAFDWIVIGTILILSIFGLTLIIQGFIRNRASVFMPETSTQMIRDMIQTKRFKDLIEFTETDPSFVSRALNPALKRAPSFSSMKEAMETSIGEQSAEQFRKIEYLNIIGNLGPLLGLLGTVLGMIMAFREMMNQGGKASPADLAGGISTALFHTFAGLALAVPCLACFGVLRTLVDRLTVRGALVAEEMLLMVKPQDTKSAAAPAAPAGAVPAPPGARPAAMPAPMPAMPPRKIPAPPPASSV